MTGVQYDICETQGMFYEFMAQKGYNIESFSELYMRTDFCNREMDASYSCFQLCCPEECIELYLKEVKLSQIVLGKKLASDVAYWIGWTYRQIQILTKIPSREIVEKLPYSEMILAYPGLHTIDEESAAEILIKKMKF